MPQVDPVDLADAMDAGFRQDTAEKVHRLLELLAELESRTSTRGRFTLKGGTALNIFHLPDVPRLSVDIDIIATGYPDAGEGTPQRTEAIQAVQATASGLAYKLNTNDSEDSGCTIHCTYRNSLGVQDRIKVDIDFVGRVTLLEPIRRKGPAMFSPAVDFPMVDRAELLAQKLVAVAYRAHARDLYDMHRMLAKEWHTLDRAPQLYRAQSFLKDYDWYRLAYPVKLAVPYNPALLEDVLRDGESAPTLSSLRETASRCLVPAFTVASDQDQAERAALLAGDRVALARIAGETDAARARLIADSPALAWRLQQAASQRAKPTNT